MPQIIDAPGWLGARTEQEWFLQHASKSGGVSVDNFEPVIGSPAPKWGAVISWIGADYAQAQSFISFMAFLRGRQRLLRIRPECCLPRAVYTRFGYPPPAAASTPHSDGSFFSDGTGYAWPVPLFTLATDVPAFGTELIVSLDGATDGFTDGLWLGLEAGLYKVVQVFESPGDGLARIGVEPPVRLPVAAGAVVTAHPSVVMQAASDEEGRFARSGRIVRPTMRLTQVLDLA